MNSVKMAFKDLALQLEKTIKENSSFTNPIFVHFRHKGTPLALCVLPPNKERISFVTLYTFPDNASEDQVKAVLYRSQSKWDIKWAQSPLKGSAISPEEIIPYLQNTEVLLLDFQRTLKASKEALENH
jgi:hypothetical protein